MDDSGQILYKVLSGLGGTDPETEKNEDLATPLSQLCRICALPNEYLIPIFEGEGQENSLADRIHTHLPIRVNSHDDYPDQVCYQCASTLLAFHDLVDCCKQANLTLSARVQLGQSRKTFTKDAAPSKQVDSAHLNKERSAHCCPSLASKALCNPLSDDPSLELSSSRTAIRPITVENQRSEVVTVLSRKTLKKKLKNVSSSTKCEENTEVESLLHRNTDKLCVRAMDDSKSVEPTGFAGCQDIVDNKETLEIKQENSCDSFSSNRDIDFADLAFDGENIKIEDEPLENYFNSRKTSLRSSLKTRLKIMSSSTKRNKGSTNSKSKSRISQKEITVKPFDEQKNVDSEEMNMDEADLNLDDVPLENYLKYSQKSVPKNSKPTLKKATIDACEKAKITVDNKTYYVCDVCGKNLHFPHTYIFHMRIHSGEKPCVCHLCGKQFRINAGLRRHLRETHQKIKNHSCDICAGKFANRQNLTQHLRIHTGERPFVCPECGKSFKQSGSLHIHRRTHTDHFPFACSSCAAKFRSRAELTHHTYKHTGEKPNVCDVCGRAFRVKHELNAHKLVHADHKPFACGDCSLSFRQRRYLRNHRKRAHLRPALTPT